MRKTISQHLGFALSCALMLLVFAGNNQAQTTAFTYQGSLIIGGSVASGSYDLEFKLYDQLTGGALQGSPNTMTVSAVAVTNGVFTVDLDFGAGAFPGAARYLEISVRPASSGSFTTLSPRQQMTSTPYAIRSLNATSADTATTTTNFSGTLAGDVTGTQGATVVSSVGGVTASNVASGATLANDATNFNTSTAIVKRDTTGSFSAGIITATGFSGSGSSLISLNASNVASGTLLDSLLSSNVAKLDTAQIFTANQAISANLIQSGSLVQFNPTDGFVAGGTLESGMIPATGAGARVMWYPKKAAFRAGSVTGSHWDDANIGYYSAAVGVSTKASGFFSFASGSETTASGQYSVAMGNTATASGVTSVAMGNFTVASGQASVALGHNTTANGDYSTAMGSNASTNGMSGSFVYGDKSGFSDVTATANNQFIARATGGLRFFASNDTSDNTKPGLFISGTTGNTQINGNLTVSGIFSGSGGSIINLSATNISSGSLDDARLSSNVALKNASNTFTANQTVNANLIQSGALVQFTPTDGFVAGGNFGGGSIPATGGGQRMMWYPGKQAFRAGFIDGAQWDNANIGVASVALGQNVTASGFNSVAMGGSTTASGGASVALGSDTTASGNYSTALGRYASTNSMQGSFVYGDNSTTTTINAAATNQFVVRAQNMWLGTNNSVTNTVGRFLETSTGAYLTTGGTWTNSSSRALKTNFATISPRDVLQKVLQLPIQTWNYKAEDANVRHIGAISQDFRQLFGFGDSAETISTVDADGVALAAIQGLHEELKDRDARITKQQQELGQLKQQVTQQQALIEDLRKLFCAQQPRAVVCQQKEWK